MDKLKSALGAAIKLGQVLDNALEDGKINMLEGGKIGIAGFQLFNQIKDFQGLKDSWMNLPTEQRLELITYFKAEFDLKNDNLEEFIEQVFEVVINLLNVLTKAK
jgi:hypothetical protein